MKTNNVKSINECLCCSNKDLYFTLDLCNQPLANSYLKSKYDEEESFPLAINFCPRCTHIQLTHQVNPDILFKEYLYVSGTSKTAKDYFKWFVGFVKNYVENGKNVLDIASNDGSQLDFFKNENYNTFGIDPASNLCEISSKKHSIRCDFFSQRTIDSFNTNFDVIIAQNVFAHISYPNKFLDICKRRLSKGGHIFIQTSQSEMIMNNEFDTIYHEHLSFFSVKSFCFLARKAGLNIVDIQRSNIHGTSFIFVLSSEGVDKSEFFISKESLLNVQIMKNYSKYCLEIASNTFEKVKKIKQEGYKVIGYGAAAKGNTFLNFSGIKLDYIVDDNPLKHFLYTPGSRIQIKPSLFLKNEKEKVCIVPLAWNFFDEIKENVKSMNLKDYFYLKYFPETEFINI